jgi:hypothetical protein
MPRRSVAALSHTQSTPDATLRHCGALPRRNRDATAREPGAACRDNFRFAINRPRAAAIVTRGIVHTSDPLSLSTCFSLCTSISAPRSDAWVLLSGRSIRGGACGMTVGVGRAGTPVTHGRASSWLCQALFRAARGRA